MNILQKTKITLLLIATLVFSACTMPKIGISNLKEVKNDEIIVVGKIQLSPRISKDEIIFENIITMGNSEDLHRSMYMTISEKYYDVETKNIYDFTDTVMALDGDYFYFTWDKNKPMHFLGTTFITRWAQRNRESMTFTINKGLEVKHSKKAKAIYIGSITFERDEFFNIKNINTSQKGYKKAIQAFRKKFNTSMKIEKAKLSSSR